MTRRHLFRVLLASGCRPARRRPSADPDTAISTVIAALFGDPKAKRLAEINRLRDGAITTNFIRDAAITTSKLRDAAILARHLAPVNSHLTRRVHARMLESLEWRP